MSTIQEQKYDDEIRFTKGGVSDDFKQQQADTRKGTKMGTEFQESLVHDRTQPGSGSLSATAPTPANAALAPIVNPSSLAAQKRHLGHVDLPDEGEFGSIHMTASEPESIQLHTQPIEKSVPSQAELPSAIGESAAEGYEYIKSIAEPQIAKAKEAITHLTSKDESAITDNSAGVSGMDKAKQTLSDIQSQVGEMYAEKIAPQVDSAKTLFAEKVQPQIDELKAKANDLTQRKTAKSTSSAPTTDRPVKTYHAPGAETESLQHRMIRYRNKAMDIWAGQEPMIKAKAQQATALIKKNKMEIPLMALGTLLVLWLSLSFIGWMAWPGKYNPVHEQVVLFNPHQGAALHNHPIHHAASPATPLANGPSQNVAGPTTLDSMKIKLSGGLDEAAMMAKDRLHHAIPSMPSMPTMQDMKDAMPSVPSVNDIKEAMPTMPHVQHMAAMPAMRAAAAVNNLKANIIDGVQNLKDCLTPSESVIPSDEPNAPPHMHTQPSQAQFQPDDRNTPPHQHNDGNIRA